MIVEWENLVELAYEFCGAVDFSFTLDCPNKNILDTSPLRPVADLDRSMCSSQKSTMINFYHI